MNALRSLFLGVSALALTACPNNPSATDAGVVVDTGPADSGVSRHDAGFGGGLGARCNASRECTNPLHRCYSGPWAGSNLRCTRACGDGDDCLDFADAIAKTTDHVTCDRPANTQGTRVWCLERPNASSQDAGFLDGGADAGSDAGAGDSGPAVDAGPGQAPGAFCTDSEQCRSGLCLAGRAGEARCTVPCATVDDCAEFNEIAHLESYRLGCATVAGHGESVCAETPATPQVGWRAIMDPHLHSIRGRGTLREGHQLRIQRFDYDGQRHGIDVVLALSLGEPQQAFAENRLIVLLDGLRCIGNCAADHPCGDNNGVCSSKTIDIDLPVGLTLDQFDRLSVFDRAGPGSVFAAGEFLPVP
jgi:hypothetical protein